MTTITDILGPPPDQVGGGKKTVSSILGPPPGGRRVPRGSTRTAPKDLPSIPFMHQARLSRADNPQEQEAILKSLYGDKAVSQEGGKFVVTVGGKKMKAESSFLASAVGAAPQLTLGALGAIGGTAIEPGFGSIAGAGAGMAAGKAIEEGVKKVTGTQRKTGMETATAVAGDFVAGAVGEGAGKLLKAPISRLSRGPLPHWVTETTAESRKMTDELLKKGARPHVGQALPGAVAMQRGVMIADAITRNTGGREAANLAVLHRDVSALLDKAGVAGAAKDITLKRLEAFGAGPALSTQDVGRLIQRDANYLYEKEGKGKFNAYLGILKQVTRTPEDAYSKLVKPGQTDILQRYIEGVGERAESVHAIRQTALKQVLAGALERSTKDEQLAAMGIALPLKSTGSLEKELDKFTPKQLSLLFPGGLRDDLKALSKEVHNLFPPVSDPGMAGYTIGQILNKPFIKFHGWKGLFLPKLSGSRAISLAYYNLYRAAVQNPAILRRLSLGLKGTSAQREIARNALREMVYATAQSMTSNSPDQQSNEAAPNESSTVRR